MLTGEVSDTLCERCSAYELLSEITCDVSPYNPLHSRKFVCFELNFANMNHFQPKGDAPHLDGEEEIRKLLHMYSSTLSKYRKPQSKPTTNPHKVQLDDQVDMNEVVPPQRLAPKKFNRPQRTASILSADVKHISEQSDENMQNSLQPFENSGDASIMVDQIPLNMETVNSQISTDG